MPMEGSARVVIDAPIEKVFAVAADIENAPAWQPTIKDATVLERDADGRQTLVSTVTDGKVRDLRAKLVFTYDEPTELRWRQDTGDLKSAVGSWTFRELDNDTTEATYSMTVELGRILGMLIRGPLVDALRGQLVDSMPGKLKTYVEARC